MLHKRNECPRNPAWLPSHWNKQPFRILCTLQDSRRIFWSLHGISKPRRSKELLATHKNSGGHIELLHKMSSAPKDQARTSFARIRSRVHHVQVNIKLPEARRFADVHSPAINGVTGSDLLALVIELFREGRRSSEKFGQVHFLAHSGLYARRVSKLGFPELIIINRSSLDNKLTILT